MKKDVARLRATPPHRLAHCYSSNCQPLVFTVLTVLYEDDPAFLNWRSMSSPAAIQRGSIVIVAVHTDVVSLRVVPQIRGTVAPALSP